MDDEKLKLQIGANIAMHRKRNSLTQAGLAAKLNYSDKAVSKWERGESVPDVLTLVQIAEQLGTTVNDLLVDPEELPGNPGNLEKAMTQVSEKALKRKANKRIILGLSAILVWFVALLAYVVLGSLGFEQSALAFLYAVPATAIVMLSLRSAWHDFRMNKIYISTIMWGVLVSFHLTMMVLLDLNLWRTYLLGIPGQIAVFLWFRLFRNPGNEEKTDGEESAAQDHP